MSDYDLIPELGDLVTILSDVYTTTTGRIIYRDGGLIRIRPYNSSNTAVDFELHEETGQFIETAGVSEVVIHEKRKSPHFSKQLGAAVGELLEFFDTKGNPAAESGIVFEVIATDTEDGIKMENGQVYDFGFVGPSGGTAENPIAVLRVRAPPAAELAPENNSATAGEAGEAGGAEAGGAEAEAEEVEPEPEPFPDIDFTVIPAALVEEVPSYEQAFSDSVQREDMFISLLVDIPVKRQKDPKIMQNLYRATDVLLALKNSVLLRDATGAVVPGIRSYTPHTLFEAVDLQPTQKPISAFLPVAAVKKVLYTDGDANGAHRDIEFRNDTRSIVHLLKQQTTDTTNLFPAYMAEILRGAQAYVPSLEQTDIIRVDQDVLRSQIPPTPVEGFLKVKPAFGFMGSYISLGPRSLSEIDNRVVRLIGGSYVTYPKGGRILIAPPDSGTTLTSIVLSNNLIRYRSPTRSSVLLWDVQASEQNRATRVGFYKALKNAWDDQIVVDETVELSLPEELGKRMRSAFSLTEHKNIEITDSLGLRDLEYNADTLAPIVANLEKTQEAWEAAFGQLLAVATRALNQPRIPSVAPLVSIDDPLFVSALSNPLLAGFVKMIQDRLPPEIANHDLLLATEILKEADTTLSPFWYAVAGELSPDIQKQRELTYLLETEATKRRTQVKRERAAELQAAPTINKCVHVHELEKIRGVRVDSSRLLLLEQFLKKYQGAQQGNWIVCGVCKEDLLCKHEILMLNEFLNPGRGASLHKSLLLEYAGPVYEGAYICKNCGQKIQEIEYDTHLEFDDEGRPLVGRTVVEVTEGDDMEEDAQKEPAENDDFNVVTIQGENLVPFKGDDLQLYYITRTMFERCGMVVNMDIYKRVVSSARDFLAMFVPPEARYIASQKKKVDAKLPPGPAYSAFAASYQIGVIAALVLLEFQTSSAVVPIPATGCPYSREGFPADGFNMETVGKGAFNYIVCVLTNINRTNVPWRNTSWANLTGKPRQTEIEGRVKQCIMSILCIPATPGAKASPPITTVTDAYRTLIREATELKLSRSSGTSTEALASRSDILPASFRPASASHSIVSAGEYAIGNVDQFQRNVATGDISRIAPVVYARQGEIARHIVHYSHIESKETGVIIPNNPRSDSVCCFRRLGAVAIDGLGVTRTATAETAEMEAHTVASAIVRRRDPALSASGTHIVVPWFSPKVKTEMPTADTTIYYKLFLKHCYQGPNYGLIHEFGMDYTCRRCKFHYPEELVYLTSANLTETNDKALTRAMLAIDLRRQEIALEAFALSGVVINTMTFNNLEIAIRKRKTIATVEPLPVVQLIPLLNSFTPLMVISPEAVSDWGSLIVAFTDIERNGLQGIQRISKLNDFSRRTEARYATLKGRAKEIVGDAGTKVVDEMLEQIKQLTESSENNIPNILSMFVVGASQVANAYVNTSYHEIYNISRNHANLLRKIWEKTTSVSIEAMKALRNLEDDEIQAVKTALELLATKVGPFLQAWLSTIRVGTHFADSEYTFIVRWYTYSVLNAVFSEASSLYEDTTSVATKRRAIQFIHVWLMESIAAKATDANTYQMNADQIAEAIHVRAELEKAGFIDKFDKLDRELRKVELMKKKLKIGDWAVGTLKNMFSYDADFFEFEREQRAAMGLPEYGAEVTGPAADAEDRYGFHNFGPGEEVGMDDQSNLRAAQDEDV